MEARKKKFFWGILAAVVACVVVAATNCFPGRAPLSAQEQACVGSWSFISPAAPNTQFVYHLAADGSVCEEHYYLTSATPTVPRLRMQGQWHVERKGQLVVEASDGAQGLLTETVRTIRSAAGDEQQEFGILRRIFEIQSVDASGISVTMSRSGGGGHEQVVMIPFAAPLKR